MTVNETFHTWKEKLLGNIGAVATVGIRVFVLYKALPTINSFLDMLIGTASRLVQLGVYTVLIVIFVTTVMHPRFWTLMWHVREMIMNSLSKILLRADPIGVLREFADVYLEELRENFLNAKAVVEAQLSKIQTQINNQQELHDSKERESASIKRNHYLNGKWDNDTNLNSFRLASQDVAFTTDTLKQLGQLEAMLQFSVTVLDKVSNALDYKIRLAQRTADTMEMRYEATASTRKALATAAEAWGSGDRARYDKQARAYVEDQIAGNIGVISTYLKALPELTSFADIQGDMASDAMMDRLKQLEAVADTTFTEAEEEQSGDPLSVLETAQKRRELVPVGRYAGLLGGEKK